MQLNLANNELLCCIRNGSLHLNKKPSKLVSASMLTINEFCSLISNNNIGVNNATLNAYNFNW